MQIDSSTLYLYVKGLNKLLISSQIRQIHQMIRKYSTWNYFVQIVLPCI